MLTKAFALQIAASVIAGFLVYGAIRWKNQKDIDDSSERVNPHRS